MRMRMAVLGLAVVLAASGAGHVRAAASDDDLSVVKKAVADDTSATTEVDREAPPAPVLDAPARAAAPAPHKAIEPRVSDVAGREPAHPGGGPRWLRVRIDPKHEHGDRVRINMPLSLARGLAGDAHLKHDCKHDDDRLCKITLGEILATLEPGQEFVSVDSEDSTVRVWID